MTSFVDATNGVGADASFIQQVIDALKGTSGKGVPLSPTAVVDAIAYAVSVKNTEAGNSRAGIFYGADGNPLLTIDKNGVQASAYGANALAPVVTTTQTQTLSNKQFASIGVGAAAPSTGGLGLQTSGAASSRVKLGGTNVVAGDFALSAGWGSTAALAVSFSGSTDSRGAVQITCGGSGLAANPTMVFTFHDGTWSIAPPMLLLTLIDNTTGVGSLGVAVTAESVTAVTITAYLTPVSGHQYVLSWIALG